jgi:hypothetical protein
MSSESYPGYPECVVSCHGAGRLTNSIRAFFAKSPKKPVVSLDSVDERTTKSC